MRKYYVTICRSVHDNVCQELVESENFDTLEEALEWAEARWDISKETNRWTQLPFGQVVRAVANDDGDYYDLMVITEIVKKES